MKSFRRRVQCLPPFPRKIMQLQAGFTGRCFVSGPFSSAKDTVNLKPVKLLFLICSRRNAADEFSRVGDLETGCGVFDVTLTRAMFQQGDSRI